MRLTEKQNYLMMLGGEQPEYIPKYSFGKTPNDPIPCTQMFEPPILIPHRLNKGGKDIWGVNYVATYETGEALLPEPNNFILTDVTKWRDIIKAPDISGIDWEKMVKDDIERVGIDRNETALALNLHFGYFQHLMSFMGFSEGMMAMFEEPDEVKELLNYVCDFFIKVAEKTIDLYKPDILTLMDDTAAWANPFISRDMYKEFLVPCHDRWAKMGRDRGLKMTMHNCGKCESILDLLVDMGINMWEPAQVCNDLDGIKKKYGNKLCIGGGWDSSGRLLDADVTDEEIFESVRATIEKRAPGGGYAWMGGYIGPVDDANVARKNAALQKAIDSLRFDFYKTH